MEVITLAVIVVALVAGHTMNRIQHQTIVKRPVNDKLIARIRRMGGVAPDDLNIMCKLKGLA